MRQRKGGSLAGHLRSFPERITRTRRRTHRMNRRLGLLVGAAAITAAAPTDRKSVV